MPFLKCIENSQDFGQVVVGAAVNVQWNISVVSDCYRDGKVVLRRGCANGSDGARFVAAAGY